MLGYEITCSSLSTVTEICVNRPFTFIHLLKLFVTITTKKNSDFVGVMIFTIHVWLILQINVLTADYDVIC